jgi:hypothetical protein
MNNELLILFIVLLLGLILCSFLGRNYVLGNTYEGMENGLTYYGPNGSIAQLNNNTLKITNEDNTETTYTISESETNTYTSPNGGTVSIDYDSNGSSIVQVKDDKGVVILTLTNDEKPYINNTHINNYDKYDNYNHFNKSSYPTIYYGPDGGIAKVIQIPGNNSIVLTNKNGSTETYYIDKDAKNINNATYYGLNGGSAKLIIDDSGKKAIEFISPKGGKFFYTGDNIYSNPGYDNTINQFDSYSNTFGSDVTEPTTQYNSKSTTIAGPGGNTYSTYDSSAFYNSLPQGIPRSQIPAGEEDLYILKSRVVPSICSNPGTCTNNNSKSLIEKFSETINPTNSNTLANNSSNITNSNNTTNNNTNNSNNNNSDTFDVTKCPPCPPCSRCPEPAFDCKKVPNYKAFNPNYMPVPVVSDFSGFGM